MRTIAKNFTKCKISSESSGKYKKLITSIAIENFIIIDRLDIDFERGFSAITGETGTGKSIILDAINFCFGKFSLKNIKKDPNKDCSIEIKFSNLSVKKIIDKTGKTSCFLNGKKIQAKELKDLMPGLLDITAQSDSILSKASQRELLDEFLTAINPNSSNDLVEISKLFISLTETESQIAKLEEEARIAKRDKTYYSQIASELSALDIKENEETDLLERRMKLAKLCSNDNLIKSSLNSLQSFAIPSVLSQVIKNLERINNEITDSLKNRLESTSIELSDVFDALDDLANDTESREAELAEIDERISTLRSVARKFNTSSSTLYGFLEDANRKLKISESFDSKLQELMNKRDQTILEYDKVADRLHEARLKAADEMSQKVCDRLTELLMPNATFKIDVQKSEFLKTQYGKDDIEFLANFNKNSLLLPFSQIASGGEAARLNFALKTVLGINSDFETIIFDEVDVGIGGAAAFAMGKAMKKLANENDLQVISITHSPQVAARADSHILIKKSISDGEISVSAKNLNNQERTHEIARMISGEKINSDAILAAQQLLS